VRNRAVNDTAGRNRSAWGQRNRRLVLAEILFGGPIARAVVARNVGLTAASVSRITQSLVDAELIEETGDLAQRRRAGRKLVGLRVKPSGGFVCGIAINAFRQDVAVADLANNTLARRRLHFDDLADPETVVNGCAAALDKLLTKSGIDRGRLAACGVAVTGAVDPNRGILHAAPAMHWRNPRLDVGRVVARRLRCPVYLDNIPNAKNLAAHCFGGVRQAENVVLLNASLAIGCSLMFDGQLMRGADFQAGMIESMMVPDFAANRLRPVDQLAGGYAVLRAHDGDDGDGDGVDGDDGDSDGDGDDGDSVGDGDGVDGGHDRAAARLVAIIDRAEHGDARAVAAVEAAGRAFAFVAATAFSILHPEKILLSGPLFDCAAYRRAAQAQLADSMGAPFVARTVQLSPLSSLQAAQSLAIHQALTQDLLTAPPAALAG